ncbi:MAG TPA: glutaredoxin 3 [Burkholderiaceae bacterium]|nr:glutaredoxin 3 [Burkholderiaceae bacterium]
MPPVKMYTKAGCPACVRAKKLLQDRGVYNIEEVRIDMNRQEAENMIRITGRRTVPQIFIDGEHIGGCDDLMMLDQRGGLVRQLRGGE